jgi:hypothetical protein
MTVGALTANLLVKHKDELRLLLGKAEIQTRHYGHFRPNRVVRDLLNEIKRLLTNCVVRKTVFPDKKRSERLAAGC